MKNVDEHKKVIGIGFHKTGTKTLGACLKTLGYRHASLNKEAFLLHLDGRTAEVFDIMEHYDSFEDWPWPLFYEKASIRFPDAKFILTLRKDEVTWFNSLSAHVRRHAGKGGFKFRKYIYGYENPTDNPQHHIDIYLQHNEKVRRFFERQQGRLLEVCWENGDNWQQLCDFLKLPLPELAFPHKNSARPMADC